MAQYTQKVISLTKDLEAESKRNKIEKEIALDEQIFEHPQYLELDVELRKTKEALTFAQMDAERLNKENENILKKQNEYRQEIEERKRENDQMQESILKFDSTCQRYKEERDTLKINMQELNDEIIQSKQIWDNEKFEMQKKVQEMEE